MTQLITLTEHSPAVVTLTLNRPERCNAFSCKLLGQFTDVLHRIECDKNRRVVILRGAGKMFCSGLDLAEATELTAGEHVTETDPVSNASLTQGKPYEMAFAVSQILVTLRRMPQVIICAPHGFACGGGGGLVAASDLVVAADDFRIMFPELKRGLNPTLLFPLLRRRLSDSALRRLVLTGMAIDAPTARDYGLVHEIVTRESLDETALRLAEKVCAGEPETLRFAKRMLQSHGPVDDCDDCDDFEAFEREMREAVEQHTRSWHSPAAREGVAAFLEKRQPKWAMS